MKEKTYYEEARRYMDNAKDSLAKSGIEGSFYKDEKYVKQAAGIAYAGVEKAARWYLKLNGYQQPLPNYDEIIKGLAKFNGTGKKLFHEVYQLLHKDAYYGDVIGVDTIKSGMRYANDFIALLQPYKNLLESENGSALPKRRSVQKNR